MSNLCANNLCCGCSACYAACPNAAITMRQDKEGFLHPHIDSEKCVNCKLCEKACPVLHRQESRQTQAVYAAKAKDDALRMVSSSGGVFSLLARKVFEKGGIVYGAAIRARDLLVHHCAAENEEELAALRRSKYVQSDMENTYREVKGQLTADRLVMFSGTPCQIAGLRQFLGFEHENLLCVDVVCHAAPSPLAWEKYLEKRTAALAQGRVSARPEAWIDARRISSRRKNCGWKRYSLSLRFANDKEYLGLLGEDVFLKGFLSELYNRPSCHACPFRECRSGSDLTIADYWDVRTRFPDMDDDTGTSLVLVNTEKGKVAYEGVRSFVEERVSDFADAVRVNPAIVCSSAQHPNRKLFFRLIKLPLIDFDWLVRWLLTPCLMKRCYWRLKGVVRKVVKRT